MDTDDRTPREALYLGVRDHKLRAELRGLARHVSRDKSRPAICDVYGSTYDGREWLTATDSYRALFTPARGDALRDGEVIARKEIDAVSRGRLHERAEARPTGRSFAPPNAVGCIPGTFAGSYRIAPIAPDGLTGQPAETVAIGYDSIAGSGERLVGLHAWRLLGSSDDAEAPALPVAHVRPAFLTDAWQALGEPAELVVNVTDTATRPTVITAAGTDAFVLLMTVRVA